MHNRSITITAGLVLGVSLLGAGYFAGLTSSSRISSSDPQQQFPLLAKRILIDNPNDPIINFVPLRKLIEERLKGLTAPYSFSFEYLPTGTTIRLGDNVGLVGASLLKLPVVMDLYKAGELGKLDLDAERVVEADMLNNEYGDLYKQGAGTKLSLREAARITLEKSDNTAILLIQKHLQGQLGTDDTAISAVDADVGVQDNSVAISSKSYSSILKCLYFACFNNKQDSQEILGYLSKSSAQGRIASGVPTNVIVAHKFGTSIKTLTDSDCGIFYVPNRPYVLCIMLGLPAEQASVLQSEISRLVYQTVTASR